VARGRVWERWEGWLADEIALNCCLSSRHLSVLLALVLSFSLSLPLSRSLISRAPSRSLAPSLSLSRSLAPSRSLSLARSLPLALSLSRSRARVLSLFLCLPSFSRSLSFSSCSPKSVEGCRHNK
jgi:hypothetical protein